MALPAKEKLNTTWLEYSTEVIYVACWYYRNDKNEGKQNPAWFSTLYDQMEMRNLLNTGVLALLRFSSFKVVFCKADHPRSCYFELLSAAVLFHSCFMMVAPIHNPSHMDWSLKLKLVAVAVGSGEPVSHPKNKNFILGKSLTYLWHILGIFWAYIEHILGMFSEYLGDTFGIS